MEKQDIRKNLPLFEEMIKAISNLDICPSGGCAICSWIRDYYSLMSIQPHFRFILDSKNKKRWEGISKVGL